MPRISVSDMGLYCSLVSHLQAARILLVKILINSMNFSKESARTSFDLVVFSYNLFYLYQNY